MSGCRGSETSWGCCARDCQRRFKVFLQDQVYIYIYFIWNIIYPLINISYIYIYVFNYLFRFTHMFADVGYICRYETLFTNMAKRDAFCLHAINHVETGMTIKDIP